jgi:2-aminoethylphosphonate dioxygenase
MFAPEPRLSPAQVADYHQDGVIVVPGFFSAPEVSELKAACEQVWAEEPIHAANPRVLWRGHLDGSKVPDRLERVSDLSRTLTALTVDPRMLQVAHDLFGEPPAFFKDKVIMKRPGTLGYGLHQDYPYWASLGAPANAYVTLFVPLDRFDGESGTIETFVGLHDRHWPPPPDDPFDCDERAIDLSRSRMLTLLPGDLMAMHSLTPHRSPPNLSGQSRSVLILTYTRASAGDLRARYLRQFA